MKPNFALSLSFEGIRLLHRSGTGWAMVGEVPLDAPDLGAALAVLRKTALALDPAGLRSKLILPNDQIKYLALDTTRATVDDVRATLEGATPYKVEELAWDFVKGGGRTYIAAVARDTLDEAEAFAADHRFGPVSFTAVPEEFSFVGEPFFGQTKVAASLLPPGESVERDAVPVKVTPMAREARAPKTKAASAVEAVAADAADAAADAGPGAAVDATLPDAVPAVAEAIAAPATDVVAVTPDADVRQASASDAAVVAEAADAGVEAAPTSDAAVVAEAAGAGVEVPEGVPLAADEVAAVVPGAGPMVADIPAPVVARAETAAPEVPPPTVAEDLPHPAAADIAPDPASPAAQDTTPDSVAEAPAPAKVVSPADPTAVDSPAAPEPAVPDRAGTLLLTPSDADAVTDDAPAPVFASRARARRNATAGAATAPVAPPPVTALPEAAAPPDPLPVTAGSAASRQADKAEPVFSRRAAPPATTVAPPPVRNPVPPPVSTVRPLAAGAPAAPARPAAPAPETVAPAAPGRISIDSVAVPPVRAVPDAAAPRITGVALGPTAKAPDRPTVVPFAPPRAPAVPPPVLPDKGARIAPFPTPARASKVETPTRAPSPAPDRAPRGKPRLLLPILLALLLAAMVIAALWIGRTDNVVSRLFRGDSAVTEVATAVPVAIPLALPQDSAASTPAPVVTAPEETAAPPEETAALPEAAAEEVGELVAAEDLPPAVPDPTSPPDAVAAAAAAAFVADAIAGLEAPAPDPVADVAPAPVASGAITAVTPEEADRFYAATGVWLRAPRLTVTPEAEDLTALSLSAMDAPPAARDGVSLPATAPDAGIVAQANPPPPGTRLPRDARGFILATPEGTVTPDGLVIFAGSPAVIPPARPGTVAPVSAPADAPTTAEAVAAALATGAPAAPPLRPQARTESFTAALPPEVVGDAAPPEAAADAEGATAGGVTLAGLRPASRPASIAALAPEPLPVFAGPRPAPRPDGLAPEGATSAPAPDQPEAIDPETALAQTLASIVEGAGDPLATATPLAVAVARRPDARPSNFDRVVAQQTERLERATAAAAARDQSAPASLGTPEEAAETEAEEVEVAAAAPSGAVPRTVSEAATMENVMSLREINLIGVYGTPNDRRALVRLDNGRYVRVSVGDSLDGGQVSAISDNALNYVRRGRTVTLEIPEG